MPGLIMHDIFLHLHGILSMHTCTMSQYFYRIVCKGICCCTPCYMVTSLVHHRFVARRYRVQEVLLETAAALNLFDDCSDYYTPGTGASASVPDSEVATASADGAEGA